MTAANPQDHRKPMWVRSIRVRLTVLYSVMLFGLASIVIGLIYWGLSRSLAETQVFDLTPGAIVFDSDQWLQDELDAVDRLSRERALSALQRYSFGALGLLFVSSLGVGWLVAGRVLAPIGRITSVARTISSTDISRRINLSGPDDELKQLADTFDDMLLRLDQAFAGQRRLIHEASHELRNPLAVIRTNVEVTASDPNATLEEYREMSEVVQRSADRMIRLVDDLLGYARQDNVPTVEETVDLSQLVIEVSEEFRKPAESRGLGIATAATPGLWVMGDGEALHQAVGNLLANALRFAPADSNIRIAAGQEEGWVWLAVEDQGPGIARKNIERVFQRGVQVDPSQHAKGSGLGLAIVRQIAEAHRGEVRVISEPGRGATFAIWLPAMVTSDPKVDTMQLSLKEIADAGKKSRKSTPAPEVRADRPRRDVTATGPVPVVRGPG